MHLARGVDRGSEVTVVLRFCHLHRAPAARWILGGAIGLLGTLPGCGSSRAQEAAPSRAPLATPGAMAPTGQGAPASGRATAAAPPKAAGLPTGLRDRGIFSHLDAQVRWRVPATLDPRTTRVIIDKARRILVLEASGVAVKAYPIALGFAPRGHKRRQGDGRTPEGAYRIVEARHQGLPAKYGARSLLLSYPNPQDARAGLARGALPAATVARIEAAARRHAVPPQTTPLGGSLRLHGGGVGRDWTLGCVAMRDPDIVELYRFVRLGTPVIIHAGKGRAPWADGDGDGIPDSADVLLGAHKAALNRARYHASYLRLAYPLGDVPATIGVCTDVIVRALRNAGIDLQDAVHRHVRARPRRYPWITRPDRNIDHRRVRNLRVWFQAHTRRVNTTVDASRRHTLLPGDVVFLDTLPRAGPDHVGIVSDAVGPGGWPRIINNWTNGYHTQEMDLLPAVPITHHYRLR